MKYQILFVKSTRFLCKIEVIDWDGALGQLASITGFCTVLSEVAFILPIASSIPLRIIAESGWLHSAIGALVCTWCYILVPI